MPLTDTKIRNLKPKEKSYKVSDFEGLYVTVRPTGARLWNMKYRFEGREKRLSFGAYPAISLAQARKMRDDAKALLAKGKDPGAVKAEQKRQSRAKSANTFAKQADAFIDKAKREGRAASTLAKTEWLLGMACSDFGSKPMSDITAQVILESLRKVEAKGNYETAKRLRSKIGAVFRYAVANGMAETDPTYALKGALIRPNPTPRAAITNPAELGPLLRAIDAFHGQTITRIALQFLSLTAQRPGEVRSAKWEEFDLTARVWSIPASKMKMRMPHEVPMSDHALGLIKELTPITGHGAFLFPSLRTVTRPMSENTLNAALRRIGYSGEEMTAHGFRATFSTLANESGLWNPDAIEKQLAHVEKNAVRKAYARGQYWDERVRMADWWGRYLDELRAS